MKKDHAMMLTLAIAGAYTFLDPMYKHLPVPWLLTIDLISAIGVFSLCKHQGQRFANLSPPWAILFVLGGAVLGTILTGSWVELVTAAQPAQRQVIEQAMLPPPHQRDYIHNLLIMVTGPAIEEIIYRLAVLGGLAYFIGRVPALLISSIIFAAVHVDVYPPAMLVPMFFFGMLYGITFLLLGLPWAIFLHMLCNWRPLLKESFDASNVVAFLVVTFSIWGLWVFISRTIRLRRILFEG